MGRAKVILATVACSAASVFVAGVVRELRTIKQLTTDADVDNRETQKED